MSNVVIPKEKLCDSGCGNTAQYFSKETGRYRCLKSASSCPINRKKNSNGLKKAHAEGKISVFTDEMREKSRINYRKKLIKNKPFSAHGHVMRKKIVMEDQDYKCSHCDLSMWMGLRITLELDHIDGNNKNNIRENLRCLCPNCHSITDTWKQGQTGKRKRTDHEIIKAWNKTGTLNATLKELSMNWGSAETVKKVLFRYKLINTI